MCEGNKILLIVSGGIAAYKAPDLVRRLRERGARVTCVLTAAAAEFVAPLALGTVSGAKVYRDLFSLTDEQEMGHIRLAREADLVLIAPATANLLAKMAAGLADDLASTVLLATRAPVLVCPAMNPAMWDHPATRANWAILEGRGVRRIGPATGETACGEAGEGRMAEPSEIAEAVADVFRRAGRLRGRRALVTSGPTFEALDPVRFIGNRSSGRQGHAIAGALARLGADTVLVSGPTALPDPAGVAVVHVESAREMLAACESALPADVAVCAAAVADWRAAEVAPGKLKKQAGKAPPTLSLVANPDILAMLAGAGNRRPRLVVGFAAETESVVANAAAKRAAKGCDWIVANDVSPAAGTFGGAENAVHLVTAQGCEDWPRQLKEQVAERLAERIADALEAVS
ncbi:MAG: bifunctional phosphopantothenoylcysteine decarboxylase/phosphopantothenate--cysteine ligase CoaBC [Magnetospirillum sp. WYHS-4]